MGHEWRGWTQLTLQGREREVSWLCCPVESPRTEPIYSSTASWDNWRSHRAFLSTQRRRLKKNTDSVLATKVKEESSGEPRGVREAPCQGSFLLELMGREAVGLPCSQVGVGLSGFVPAFIILCFFNSWSPGCSEGRDCGHPSPKAAALRENCGQWLVPSIFQITWRVLNRGKER